MTLGERLKKSRERKNLTQQDAADFMGISNGTLSGYERNYRDPDTETLLKMARLYNVSPDFLLSGEEMEPVQLELKQNGPALDYENEYHRLLDEHRKLKEQNKLLKQIIKNFVEIDL